MAVVRFEVTRREPVLGGARFGAGSAYEKIEGVLHFAVDPARPVHAPIVDLSRAPRNGRGLVESWADFSLLRPTDGGRRRLLLDVPNRGRKIALGMFNSAPRTNDPTTREDFGNGAAQPATVYGRVPAGQYVPATNYADQITVKVTY